MFFELTIHEMGPGQSVEATLAHSEIMGCFTRPDPSRLRIDKLEALKRMVGWLATSLVPGVSCSFTAPPVHFLPC